MEEKLLEACNWDIAKPVQSLAEIQRLPEIGHYVEGAGPGTDGGTLAYELSGTTGTLLVPTHGMGDSRTAYRFLIPRLMDAGYRVAALDLRGHGESSVGWAGYTRTDIAGDLRVASNRGGLRHLMGMTILGSTAQRIKYLDVAYPGTKPVDHAARLQQIATMLAQPGRMKALQGRRPLPGPGRAGQCRLRLGRSEGRG